MTWKKITSYVLVVLLALPAPPAFAQEGGGGPAGGPGAGAGGLGGPGGFGAPSGGPGGLGAPGTGAEPGADLKGQAQFYLQTIPSPLTGPGQMVPGVQGAPAPGAPPGAPPAPGEKPAQTPGMPAAEGKAEAVTPTGEGAEEALELTTRAGAMGVRVQPFGYNLFRRAPSTFAPVKTVPVGPDYVIGPGDTVRIVLWGSIQADYAPTVDRNGQIALPKVGVVQVSSLTFKQLREVLDREFSRQYTNFQMNITLDNLRTIQIYAVGWARSPGSYTISSLSTLVSALFDCGGPSLQGSMRDIQVRRGGRVILHFDLYDFLKKGDKSKDIRLLPEDVIYFPLARERVAIGGPVKSPAIYELKGERTLMDLINLAGGLAPVAFKGRVQMLRIRDRQELVLFEEDLEKVLTGRIQDIPLRDADLVRVFAVPSVIAKRVSVAGAVSAPGEFGVRDGMRIKDLMELAGGPVYYANLEEAELTRVTVTPGGPETTRITINLRRALTGNPRENILVRHDDFLFVRTVPEWDLYKMVRIGGEVKFPGSYTIKKGETISSLLLRSGGFTDKAYVKGAFFTRPAVKQIQTQHLKQAIQRIEAELLAKASEAAETEELSETKRSGLILKTQQAFLKKLKEITPLGRIVIYLDDPERLRGTPGDIELQEGDQLVIPMIQQSVNILGSVVNPTAVLYEANLSVKDYVQRAGGYARYSDKGGIYVMKANGSALSARAVGWAGNVWDGRNYVFQIGGFQSLRLEPGDTIVVPEDVERIAWMKELKDIVTIISQIALTAGVVIAALK